MQYVDKSQIKVGMYLEKDCPIVATTSKPQAKATISDIAKKLERVRKKLAVVAQFVAQNRGRT